MLNYNGYFIAFLWYNKSILLETTILRMYVEGDKGTGRFITSLGVYVCGVVHVNGCCNSIFDKNKSFTTNSYNQTISFICSSGSITKESPSR